MKVRLAGLLFASLLAIGSGIGVASAVSFDRSYADPASDVVELWASNMTPVLTDGNLTMSPFPDSVNVLRLASADAGADIALTIQVKGSIANLDNTSYQIRIYARQDNSTHFRATYVNDKMMLTSNATGFVPIDISPGLRLRKEPWWSTWRSLGWGRSPPGIWMRPPPRPGRSTRTATAAGKSPATRDQSPPCPEHRPCSRIGHGSRLSPSRSRLRRSS